MKPDALSVPRRWASQRSPKVLSSKGSVRQMTGLWVATSCLKPPRRHSRQRYLRGLPVSDVERRERRSVELAKGHGIAARPIRRRTGLSTRPGARHTRCRIEQRRLELPRQVLDILLSELLRVDLQF